MCLCSFSLSRLYSLLFISPSSSSFSNRGIEKKVHRLAVLSAIERLKESQERKKGEDGKQKEKEKGELLHSVDSIMDIQPETRKGDMIDVFISYRRKGGSVLAHLLRRELQMSGLTVFLDVENLGTGDFRSSLLSNLKYVISFPPFTLFPLTHSLSFQKICQHYGSSHSWSP